MTSSLVGFVSPSTGRPLAPEGGDLVSSTGDRFPVVRGIPRFVAAEGYAASFGLEWRLHARTQLDSHTGAPISRHRLERCLGEPVESLAGQRVLEAGCGAGRFTELMVGAGALVHAIDMSLAVEANRDNIGDHAHYVVAQADLLQPPFPEEAFDLVVCLGVFQHLPSPEAGIRALWSRVRPGGRLVLDHYTWSLSLLTKLAPLYRFILCRLPPARAKTVTDRLVDVFFPLHWATRNLRAGQMLLSRISPCLVYFRVYPELSRRQHFDLCRLDTFDSLTDRYKRLRTAGQIRRALQALGAQEVEVSYGGNGVEARCRKPLPPASGGQAEPL